LEVLLANVEEIAGLFLPRSWTLVRFESGCLFTSEHPVIYINTPEEPVGYGVATAVQIYVPVSVTHGLVLSRPWAGWPNTLVRGTDELARRLNWAVLTFPPSDALLLHPDIDGHPLPSPTVLEQHGYRPWPAVDHGPEMPELWERLVANRERRRAATL
jgi:hypothetical protein